MAFVLGLIRNCLQFLAAVDTFCLHKALHPGVAESIAPVGGPGSH